MSGPSGETGFIKIPVLNFLWGYPYNDFALSIISGLQPSEIKLGTIGTPQEARLDEELKPGMLLVRRYSGENKKLIFSIHWIVEVKLPHGVDSAYDLSLALQEQGIHITAAEVELEEKQELEIPANLQITEEEYDRRVAKAGEVQGLPSMD